MAKPLNLLEGFTLNDLLSPDGFTLEIGDEYLEKEEEDKFSYNPNVFLSNEELINMLNMDDFKIDEAEENNEATGSVPFGISFATMKTKMTPITKDGKIMKLIKQKGVGKVVPYNAQVTIKYISYFEYNDEPFDSTYAHGHPKTIRLNQNLLIPGLELAITSMEKHEIAIFIIHPDLAYGSIGCLPRILPNEEVMFIIHLVDFLDNGSAYSYLNLNVEEQKLFSNIVKSVNDLLNTAKHNFTNMKIKKAIRQYEKTIRLLEDAELKDDKEEEEVKRLLSRSYNNLAICFNKEEMPRRAAIACNKVPIPTVKTYFNRGKALVKIGEYTKGLKELQIAYKMEPNDKDIYKEICLANEKYNKHNEIEKRLWFNCFNSSKQEKNECEFQKAAREMCESFVRDNYLSRQPFPEGLTREEENYIREQAAALGLNVVSQTKYGKNILYLTKIKY